MIRLRCDCGATFEAKNDRAGKVFKCSVCGKPLQVPVAKSVNDGPDIVPSGAKTHGWPRLWTVLAVFAFGVSIPLVILGAINGFFSPAKLAVQDSSSDKPSSERFHDADQRVETPDTVDDNSSKIPSPGTRDVESRLEENRKRLEAITKEQIDSKLDAERGKAALEAKMIKFGSAPPETQAAIREAHASAKKGDPLTDGQMELLEEYGFSEEFREMFNQWKTQKVKR